MSMGNVGGGGSSGNKGVEPSRGSWQPGHKRKARSSLGQFQEWRQKIGGTPHTPSDPLSIGNSAQQYHILMEEFTSSPPRKQEAPQPQQPFIAMPTPQRPNFVQFIDGLPLERTPKQFVDYTGENRFRPSDYAGHFFKTEQAQVDNMVGIVRFMEQEFGQYKMTDAQRAYEVAQDQKLRQKLRDSGITGIVGFDKQNNPIISNDKGLELAGQMAQVGFPIFGYGLILGSTLSPRQVEEKGRLFRTPPPQDSVYARAKRCAQIPTAKPLSQDNDDEDKPFIYNVTPEMALNKTFYGLILNHNIPPSCSVDFAREGFSKNSLEDFTVQGLDNPNTRSVNQVKKMRHIEEGDFYKKEMRDHPYYVTALMNEEAERVFFPGITVEQAVVYNGVDQNGALTLDPILLSKDYTYTTGNARPAQNIANLLDDTDPYIRVNTQKTKAGDIQIRAVVMGDIDAKIGCPLLMRGGKDILYPRKDGGIGKINYGYTESNYVMIEDKNENPRAVHVDLDIGLPSFRSLDGKGHSVKPRISEGNFLGDPGTVRTNTAPIMYGELKNMPRLEEFFIMAKYCLTQEGVFHPDLEELAQFQAGYFKEPAGQEGGGIARDFMKLVVGRHTHMVRTTAINQLLPKGEEKHPFDPSALTDEQIDTIVAKVVEDYHAFRNTPREQLVVRRESTPEPRIALSPSP